MKKYLILLTFTILAFIGCSNQIEPGAADSVEDNGISVTLSYRIDGALPAEVLRGRMAYPSLENCTLYAYARDTEENIPGVTNVVTGTPVDDRHAFTIGNLEPGKRWYFTVELRDGDDNILMSDETSKDISTVDNILNHVFVLRPDSTSGNGKVALTINTQSPVTTVMAYCDDDGWPFGTHIDSISAGTYVLGSETIQVPAGTYNVRLVFYGTTSENEFVALYSDIQTVNVFKNMTTNTWRNNGSSTYNVTLELLQERAHPDIYVGAPQSGITVDELNTGSAYSPYDSISRAIEYIRKVGTSSKAFTIHISGEQIERVELNDSLNNRAQKITLTGTHTAVNGNTVDVINANQLTPDSTGYVVHINTNFPVEIKNLKITGGQNTNAGGGIRFTGPELILGEDLVITGNYAESGAGVYIDDDCSSGVVKLRSNVYIFGNKDTTDNHNASNLYIAKKTHVITVLGPLYKTVTGTRYNAKIGIDKSTDINFTLTNPVTFTQGYGYNTDGNNEGVPPGRYFIGDRYGVTDDGPSGTGEAVFSLSGGYLEIENLFEDVTIGIDRSFVSTTGASKVFTFNANGIDEQGSDVAIQAGSGAGRISYSYTLLHHGETVPASDSYYIPGEGTNINKFTLGNDLPAGEYTILVTAVYNGETYSAGFDINYVQPQDFTEEPVFEGNYVYFGDFPQTKKPASVEIDEDMSITHCGFTCYLGSDGAWYVTNASNGTTSYFKMEPIKWRILTYDYNGSGKRLLLAEKILYSNVPYYGTNNNFRMINDQNIWDNNYEYSQLRAYLNGLSYNFSGNIYTEYSDNGTGFLQTAFTTQAQTKIAVTTVTSDSDCNETNDKVFVLSKPELKTTSYGFESYDSASASRIHEPTDYAYANNLSSASKAWWTRSKLQTQGSNDFVCDVISTGAFGSPNVKDKNIGIVPAICLE